MSNQQFPMTNDQLSKTTDFFRPNRLIWQEADPAGGNVDADTDADTDDNFDDTENDSNSASLRNIAGDLSRALSAMHFQEQAEYTCNLGGSAVECSLAQIKELVEISRQEEFIRNMYNKLLVKNEGHKKEKDSFKCLQELKRVFDMERIMSAFQKSESHEIKSYTDAQWSKNHNLTDKIIFKYKNGEIETIDLELTFKQKVDFFRPIVRWLNSIAGESRIMSKKEKSDIPKKNVIHRISLLTTPDAVYSELISSTTSLSDPFLNEISVPLAEYAEVISSLSDDILDHAISEEDKDIVKDILYRIKSISDNYGYGYYDSVTEDERMDFAEIGKIFGIV